MRKTRIGLVQNAPKLGRLEENLAEARALVEGAAREGASVVFLPELSLCGFRPALGQAAAAEPAGGRCDRWLSSTARELGLVLGAGYLEARGGDLFNVYVLAGPDGRVLGRVGKESPSMGETYVFASEPGGHVVDTPLGRVGVGICNDSHMAYLPRKLLEAGAELVVMPHAWPLPDAPSRLVDAADIGRQARNMEELAGIYARSLGVPALLTNLAGRLDMGGERSPGFLGALLPPPESYRFPAFADVRAAGGARIASREGRGEPGFLVAEVELVGHARKAGGLPAYGRRVYEANADSVILRLYEALGRRSYRRGRRTAE
ncbi:MAG TPA: carbon-nitrogen hydrolase family protein [Spirochaetia bacterium]|nr:carbon-nitrogen hydrolase family protein [Spirochaetales bacterium]HRY73142.1 carbon-nitrogen hydrolase family protein [Spirochaetia bacterium]